MGQAEKKMAAIRADGASLVSNQAAARFLGLTRTASMGGVLTGS